MGRKRTRKRGGYAEKMKQELSRLQEERDADHQALRTAVNLSGHLVLGSTSSASAASDEKGSGKGIKGKGKGKSSGKGKGQDKGKNPTKGWDA